ncbi:hypothetical protein BREVNS_2023 [Brevinematales bacterium NS]|nr:hypothetical protein BREVNS_2023 [Brevinematales bacterium NS]
MIFQFTVQCTESEILAFEKEVMDILSRVLGSSSDALMRIHEFHFCIHESILNILQHTYKWDMSQKLEIRLQITEEGEKRICEVTIRDFGPPVPKKLVPPDSVDRFQMRKRGLYMMSKILDEFSLTPQSDGNVTYLKKIFYDGGGSGSSH